MCAWTAKQEALEHRVIHQEGLNMLNMTLVFPHRFVSLTLELAPFVTQKSGKLSYTVHNNSI